MGWNHQLVNDRNWVNQYFSGGGSPESIEIFTNQELYVSKQSPTLWTHWTDPNPEKTWVSYSFSNSGVSLVRSHSMFHGNVASNWLPDFTDFWVGEHILSFKLILVCSIPTCEGAGTLINACCDLHPRTSKKCREGEGRKDGWSGSKLGAAFNQGVVCFFWICCQLLLGDMILRLWTGLKFQLLTF